MWDAIVLGIGGVGSFALRALAKDKQNGKILGTEQFTTGHANGSSHGHSQVYRRAYFEHPIYVPWVNHSLAEFSKLHQRFGAMRPIMLECGVLLIVPATDTKMLDKAAATAKEHNIEVEILSHQQLKDRFPQIQYSDTTEMLGLYEPGGGVVNPENAIHAALEEAQEQSAVLWENTRIISIEEIMVGSKGGHVNVTIKRGEATEETIQSKKVVIAAGAWTSKLIPSFGPHLKVLRQLQSWVNVSSTKDPMLFDGNTRMPAMGAVIPGLLLPVFALPADFKEAPGVDSSKDVLNSCIKLGIHGRNYPIDPDQNPSTVSEEEKEEMKATIAKTFIPEIGALPLFVTQPCMYTMTDDDHFMIGVPKGYRQVCVVAGLSGHGFKMAPALGQMLADFALDKGIDEWKAEFCSPSRYGV